ncbi:hypothetical protein [Clostridium novyi]|uniref:Uncharacterized protein n=1 Tax=Clostridium novyi (strain NT) TaxID=386415 RepID=A0Q3S5_CLONN|nr:hypothetical protein [Clostridium novyi]ABK62665.1 conserved hypothetical protein [Clostridium novyi NT]KEH85288.1 hypothetical protein Z966_07645 [Clostridium novyi A str. NCTC 538]
MENVENQQVEEVQQEIDYKAEYERMIAEREESKLNSLINDFNAQLNDTFTDEFLKMVTEDLKTKDYDSAEKTINLIKEASDLKNHKTKLRIVPNRLNDGEALEPNEERKTFQDIILMERKNR